MADPAAGVTTVRDDPDRAWRLAVMDGRRLFEIIVVIVGLAILFSTLVWFWWVMSNFGDPR